MSKADPARALILELYARERMKQALRNDMFDKQLGVYDDPTQFKACHPGRRGGKSDGMPRSAALLALDAGFNEVVIIAAETQKKARSLHWDKLLEICIRHKLPLTPNGQEGAFVTPWGAKIVFWGLNDNGAVQLLRGFKLKGCFFDEVQTYESKLPTLVKDVLEPALGDTGGPCTLFGTPSLTAQGEWAEICLGVTPGWSVHHWDVRQNKKFPRDAMSMLRDVLNRNKLVWDFVNEGPLWDALPAWFKREYLGLFVDDLDSQVYKYVRARNSAEALPVREDRGFCSLGIDYGTTDDPCAWVVVWSPHGSREMYVVDAKKEYGMLPDDAAVITKELIDRWNPQRIVGDGGGLGSPYVAAFNRRYGHIAGRYVALAEKQGKLGQIAIVNGELATGRIKFLSSAQPLADELQVLAWKDGKRKEENPKHPDDLADAFRYCVTAHFTDIPVKEAPPKSAAEIAREEQLARQKAAQAKRHAASML